MPLGHSVPVYKAVKVATKIGIILYCYKKKYDINKWKKKLYPVASGTAASLLVGMPTLDFLGLMIVGIKVFRELTSLDIDAETMPMLLGKFPLVNGGSVPIIQEDAILHITLGSSFMDGAVNMLLSSIGGTGVAGEIAAAILEEFKFDSFADFFHNLVH
jgi:hypothetical protein